MERDRPHVTDGSPRRTRPTATDGHFHPTDSSPATEGPLARKRNTDLRPVAEPEAPPVDTLPAPVAAPQPASDPDASHRLQQFWDETPDLDTEVDMILNYPHLLSAEQLVNLHAILTHYLPEVAGYDATFDFQAEVGHQIAAVRAMRQKVMGPGNTLKEGVSTREAKEVISASTTLLTTLMKHHENILNFERQRALEEAVKAAVGTLPEDARTAFFGELEARLGETT